MVVASRRLNELGCSFELVHVKSGHWVRDITDVSLQPRCVHAARSMSRGLRAGSRSSVRFDRVEAGPCEMTADDQRFRGSPGPCPPGSGHLTASRPEGRSFGSGAPAKDHKSESLSALLSVRVELVFVARSADGTSRLLR